MKADSPFLLPRIKNPQQRCRGAGGECDKATHDQVLIKQWTVFATTL
jgi:hypothetical protein